jgi:SAM-dependent methyltransferase
MSAVQQNMINATGAARTGAAMFFGQHALATPKRNKTKPSQWVNWTLEGPVTIDTTFRVSRERLVESIELESGERVLSVTSGTADASLRGAARLPFRSSAFDVVLSGFGAIYAGKHYRMSQELLRVCRPGGRIGLTSWTPDGFDGQLISIVSCYLPHIESYETPADWGTREYLNAHFGDFADALGATNCTHTRRSRSPEAWLSAAKAVGGRLHNVYRSVDPDWHDQLSAEILALVDRCNDADDGSMVVQIDYVEFLIHKSNRK